MITTATAKNTQLIHRIHDLEARHIADTAQIQALHAVIADGDAHLAVLKDFIETQDETHADEMALLNHVNAGISERLNREVAARHERMARTDAQADGLQLGDAPICPSSHSSQIHQSQLMSRVRLLVAAQAYDILAGYGTHYRELARTVDDCIEALKGQQPRDSREPVLKAMQAIKSACHTLADNIAACREGGIHENFSALWPGSLEPAEAASDTPGNKGVRARGRVRE